LALIVVVILAIPVLSLRQGFADDSGKPVGSPARIAYDLRAEGFGPGINGPFLVVADLTNATDPNAYGAIVKAIAGTEGVAATNPSVETLAIFGKLAQASAQSGAAAAGSAQAPQPVQAIAVYPTSAPQDQATMDLLERLRTQTDPALEQETGAKIYVGGTQAITSDFTSVLADALPLFLAIVIGLGFLALMLLFHSVVIPLTAAITSLLSFSAALGITVAVFQWGWFDNLLGVPGTGPIFPFLPIMVFSILFGLSMDYQVFLVTRMKEEWNRTGDNAVSVRRGLGGSGRVVVIAALIMSSVFLAFVPSTNATIKLFGISLASAVLIDAFIIRLIFVPSLMSMLGRANWWLPGWLDKILPEITIEAGEDEVVDDDDAKKAVASVQ
jgi:RND superfamily putative drug exporter